MQALHKVHIVVLLSGAQLTVRPLRSTTSGWLHAGKQSNFTDGAAGPSEVGLQKKKTNGGIAESLRSSQIGGRRPLRKSAIASQQLRCHIGGHRQEPNIASFTSISNARKTLIPNFRCHIGGHRKSAIASQQFRCHIGGHRQEPNIASFTSRQMSKSKILYGKQPTKLIQAQSNFLLPRA